MLVALDLTVRQAARVLAQAVRTHAKLEIDPRPEFLDAPLWGSVEGQERDLLAVKLLTGGDAIALPKLVGAMCDVRTILSEQLYLFTTVIVDVAAETAPRRLHLAAPQNVQVANRRRYTRKSPLEPIPVRLTLAGRPDPYVGSLANISRTGLACRVLRRELEELLFIGDEVQLEFVLPWATQIYSLPAQICGKNLAPDQEHVSVGFEFIAQTAATQATLELLRVALDNETERLTELDGETL